MDKYLELSLCSLQAVQAEDVGTVTPLPQRPLGLEEGEGVCALPLVFWGLRVPSWDRAASWRGGRLHGAAVWVHLGLISE